MERHSLADQNPPFHIEPAEGFDRALSLIHGLGLSASMVADGASIPDLRILLEQAKLSFESLFAGPDDEILENEAPLLVSLPYDNAATVSVILSRLSSTPGAAYILIGHPDERSSVRRHLRKWLSVRLPKTVNEWTIEDKPVLFRFYDPMILGLFLGSLTVSDAAAFGGPIKVWATDGVAGQIWKPKPETLAATPSVSGLAIFRIRPEQYVILAQHSVSKFETALFTYLRGEFSTETADMDDAALNRLIDQAKTDGHRIGDTRPGSVVSLAVLRLLRPDLMQDDFVWSEVMGNNPEGKDPKQRIGLLEAYHFTDLETVEAFDAFYDRLAGFWDYY